VDRAVVCDLTVIGSISKNTIRNAARAPATPRTLEKTNIEVIVTSSITPPKPPISHPTT
jgi:hypothetical protein